MKLFQQAAVVVAVLAATSGCAVAADPTPVKPPAGQSSDTAAPPARSMGATTRILPGMPTPRGQIEGLTSDCDVTPPCPKGCFEDKARKACSELDQR